MSKTRTVFECQSCGSQFPKWLGRCSECGGWNTFVESVIGDPAQANAAVVAHNTDTKIVTLGELDIIESHPIPTGIGEFDLVLSGGLVPGSVTLIGGEPGIGKSTLVMQILGSLAKKNVTSLYASAEESNAQIRGRASRLGITSDKIGVLTTSRVEDIIHHAKESGASVVVVDSIHTLTCDDISSSAGTVSQVRECAHRLTAFAKQSTTTIIVVGQVTKEGALAGPKVLEHVVDTVLSFEGDDNALVRTLRASKHRYGNIDELGLFDMSENGLVELDDPQALMTITSNARPSGLAVGVAVDGSRPFLIEVQALVVPTTAPIQRRVVQGIETARVNALVAVLEKRCDIKVSLCDIYVSLVGGVKIRDAGLDLAIIAALASAEKNISLPRDLVFAGEVGLSGELRPATHTLRRVREASRRGHGQLFINTGKTKVSKDDAGSINISNQDTVKSVLNQAGL